MQMDGPGDWRFGHSRCFKKRSKVHTNVRKEVHAQKGNTILVCIQRLIKGRGAHCLGERILLKVEVPLILN